MSEAINLFSTQKPAEHSVTNDDLKARVGEILKDMQLGAEKPEGSKVKGTAKLVFDREARVFSIVSEDMSKKDTAALMKRVAEFRTPEAEQAWAGEREKAVAAVESVRDAARTREATTTETGPRSQRRDAIAAGATEYVMYRTGDKAEAKAFKDLLVENKAASQYHPKAMRDGEPHPHYTVVTEAKGVEKAFAAYMGEPARDRMMAWGRENLGKPVESAKEQLRQEVQKRSGGAFMAKYAQKGLMVFGNTKDGWMNDAAAATDAQLTRVHDVTVKARNALLDKELTVRSEQSGMSKPQLKELADAGNFRELAKHGEGLDRNDRATLQALTRGAKAIEGILVEDRGKVLKETRAPKGGEKPAREEGAETERQPRSAAKGPSRDVDSNDAAADAVAAVMASRRSGAGR